MAPMSYQQGETFPGQARPRMQVNATLLVTGAALAGVGSLLGIAGLAISAAALGTAIRHWMTDAGVPPSELARQQWTKARAATSAGASAWRETQGRAGQPVPSGG
jgi:hypothetical protein